MTAVNFVRVFEFKRGGRRRGWICSPCAEPFFQAGTFHAPVYVPVPDLEGAVCMCCKRPIIKEGEPNANRG